jgi:hypothetical protein
MTPRNTLLAALLLSGSIPGAGFDVDFAAGGSTAGFALKGSAVLDAARGAVRLTDAAGGQAGSIFHLRKVSTGGLTVRFTVSLGGGSGADGLAFAIVSGAQAPAIAGGGGYLGLGGLPGPLIVLEADTWGNGIPDAQAPDGSGAGNHFGIRYAPGAWDISSDALWEAPFPLDDGSPIEIVLSLRNIDEGGTTSLEAIVRVRSEAHRFEISPVLELRIPGVEAFEGFPGWSAATGGATNRHLLHRASLEDTALAEDFPDRGRHLAGLLFDHYPARPPLASGDRVYVVDTGLVPGAQEILASTLAGLLGRTSPRVYLKGGGYDWMPALRSAGAVFDTTYQADAVPLLGRFKGEVSGYILYRGTEDSINVATSLSGVLDAVAAEEALEERIAALGIPRLLDVRDRDEAWLLDNYSDRLFRGVVIQQREDKRQLRDAAALWGALIFFDGNGAIRDRAFDLALPDSPVLGWGEGGEDQFVGAASSRGLFTIPSDWAWNLGIHSAVRLPAPIAQKTRLAAAPDRGSRAHFVTFVMSDGDNLQWLLNDFSGSGWFGSALRGSFPMGWTVAPHLARLAPVAMKRYYEMASAASSGRDYFVAGVSGGGYLYPSLDPVLDAHAQRLEGYLAAADLDIVSILELNRNTFTTQYLDPYTRLPRVRGILYLDYASYAAYRGKIVWSNGKPAASARFSLWEGQDDPAEIAASVAASSFDPRDPGAYSFVNVHPWSRTLDDVKATIDLLPAGAVVVTPDEFIAQMVRNLGTGPTARIHARGFDPEDPIEVETGETLGLDGRFSTDPNWDIARYEWDLDGDGDADATGPSIERTYSSAGDRTMKLIVTDSGGRSAEASRPVSVSETVPAFVRGDANADGAEDISDGIAVLAFLFLGSAAPACREAMDSDDSGETDISDAIRLLAHLFTGGSPPAQPFPGCGTDPTPDAIGCGSFPPCP